MSSEVLNNYSIKIELPDGSSIIDRQLASTKWHAIEKSFVRYSSKQSDRTKYSIKSKY